VSRHKITGPMFCQQAIYSYCYTVNSYVILQRIMASQPSIFESLW